MPRKWIFIFVVIGFLPGCASLTRSASLTSEGTQQPVDPTQVPAAVSFSEPTPAAGSGAEAEIPSRLVPGICTLPVEKVLDSRRLPQPPGESLDGLIGGGTARSGVFTYDLYLVCDSRFSQEKVSGHAYTEIDGLGVVALWRYRGPDMEGEIRRYSGMAPFVREKGRTGPVRHNPEGGEMIGLQFPAGVLPDFTREDARLSYVLKTETPDGALAGAVLSFTLKREPDGYHPVDIRVNPLPEKNLQAAESPPNEPISFPTEDPLERYPLMRETRELIDRYQGPLTASPGWIHMVLWEERPGGGGLYPTVTAWTEERWLRVDEEDLVVAEAHVDRAEAGRILQQVASRDGEAVDFIFGIRGEYSPYSFDLGDGLLQDLFYALRAGQDVIPGEVMRDGRRVLLFSFQERFSNPRMIEDEKVSSIREQVGLDPETGALLFWERWRKGPAGEEDLDWRRTYQTVERVGAPPEEIRALFEREMAGYRPPPPEGTSTPLHFDPSQSALRMRSIPGGNFERPEFFYGDLCAEDYLLGRVNFGQIPGGWCDRSPDGSRIAFNYIPGDEEREGHGHLRWFTLRDLETVHNPYPDMRLFSPLTWGPDSRRLAFTASVTGQREDRALYVLDVEHNQLQRLPEAAASPYQAVWRPDGGQLVSIVPLPGAEGRFQLVVVDVASGEVVYQGEFNAELWRPGPDSPTHDWGVAFERGISGFGRCQPPP